MRIEWKGHASFLLVSSQGVRVLTDPFDEYVGYPLPNVEVDVATVSHQHGDHNFTASLPGKPVIVEGAGEHEAAGIVIKGVATYHDPEQGKKRGENTVFVIQLDGLNICHLGDLGHLLTSKQVSDIGQVDVLLIPVGGFFTIDAKQAYEVVKQLRPALVLPMHYKLDERVTLPIEPVDEFHGLFPKVERKTVLDVDKSSLPGKTEVVLLELR
ncbi:MBL fold metallo-hydrolase [Pelotomaculum terephthalicicum JT]|uniref:MBL fold metallo-hydrolase n=1 Tax=Pelotomaculum TaxID=191373 RepID=UPI0009C71E04|nr:MULTISPECIES: MBL fold metallo-hydrolase [Pelotomaculum]MCG9969395.1 MBL fold metallo-hydrolase [Pelotomaculum terephthalicicum JT]OPX87830.1 MAG: metal-dependent hydrolase [Pelotomaculum sp. PtaB.Bin117]OPY63090.1 MAG: metal-dependent hydrolase [Pelotomaculum sp. PtaU1.Bin065]